MLGRDRSPPDPDRVELLPLHDSRFGTADESWLDTSTGTSTGTPADKSAGADGDEPSGWTRRAAIGAALLGCALIAVATLTSNEDASRLQAGDTATSTSITSPTSSAATAPTPIAPVTTTPSAVVVADPAPQLVPQRPIGYVLGDVPADLSTVRAYSWSGSFGLVPMSDVQLWASPFSSRSTGSWLLVQTSRTPVWSDLTSNGHRVAIGDRHGVMSTASDGVLELRFSLDGLAVALSPGQPNTAMVVVAGFGIAEDALLAIAASITIDAADIATVAMVPDGLTNRIHSHEFVSDVFSSAQGYNADELASTMYSDGDLNVMVNTASRPPADMHTLLPYLLVDGVQESIHNRRVWIGVDPMRQFGGGTPQPVTLAVFFDDDGKQVTVSTATVDPTRLREMVGSLRRASGSQWEQLVEDTRLADQEAEEQGSSPMAWVDPRFVDVARSAKGETPRWLVRVAPENHGTLSVGTRDGEIQTQFGEGVQLQVFTTSEVSVAVATAGPADGVSTLRVTVDGVVIAEAPVATFADGTIAAAGLGFDDLGAYVVELLDAGGAVVATSASA